MPAARPDPDRIFQPIASCEQVALAVSGGSDSMALLRLAAEWRGRPSLTVLTVDHGLRAESAREARKVLEWAGQAGLSHVTLQWRGAKPQTGIQAKARKIRYDLMTDWCRENGVPVLLTAHTLEDQAETVLMRLTRTTSLESLAGIYRFSNWRGTEVFRPLLEEHRETLRAYLRSLGQAWIEDPSNADDRFERVRVRKAMPGLEEVGITAEALAALAQQAQEAVQGLWGATDDWVKLHVEEFETGYCRVPLQGFTQQPQALRIRILGRLISRFGAGKMPDPAELQRLLTMIDACASRRTLGGAIVAPRKDHLIIGREPRRIDPSPVIVPEAGVVLWDGRFEVHAEAGNRIIPAICAEDLRRHRSLPWFVQASLPAIVGKDRSITVPHLGLGSGARILYQPRLALTSHLH